MSTEGGEEPTTEGQTTVESETVKPTPTETKNESTETTKVDSEDVKRKRRERFGAVEENTNFQTNGDLEVDLSDLIAKGKKNKSNGKRRAPKRDKDSAAPPAKEAKLLSAKPLKDVRESELSLEEVIALQKEENKKANNRKQASNSESSSTKRRRRRGGRR